MGSTLMEMEVLKGIIYPEYITNRNGMFLSVKDVQGEGYGKNSPFKCGPGTMCFLWASGLRFMFHLLSAPRLLRVLSSLSSCAEYLAGFCH